MTEERFNEMTKAFFKAVKEKTLLIIIDTASRNEKAVFSLVSFRKKNDAYYGYINYGPWLTELGFKTYRGDSDVHVTYCAGRHSLYILDNIVSSLRGRGVKIPKGCFDWIQFQNAI